MDSDQVHVRGCRALFPAFLLVVFAGWVSVAEAGISLAPAANYPVGRSGNVVRNLAAADFNGDGKPDLAVPNSSDRDVSILTGEGDGRFSPAGTYTIDTGAGGNSPRFVVAADFNRDGKSDLAVADYDNDEIVVLLGDGDGSFQGPVSYGTGTGPIGVVVGDFNRDGLPDLATANNGSANISILRGNGNGTFQGATNFGTGAGTGPHALAAGDFDGDGDLDLVVASRTVPGTVCIMRNNGSGSFALAGSSAAGDNARSLAVGDFNRDGRLDLAVANEAAYSVSIHLGNGNGTFQTAASHPAGSVPRSVAAADLDGDGVLDLAVTDGNDNFVHILRGDGDGSFQAAVPFMVGRRPDGVACADFNGDGKPDVATANTNSDSEPFGIWNISVLLNASAYAPAGLLAAKVDYPVELNPNSLAAGDFNGDGVLDLVTANLYSDSVSCLQGAGDGTFAAAASFGAGAYPYWVTAGDFNRDGKPDLAVANVSQEGTVSILLGNGNGTFQAPLKVGVGVYPVFVTAEDFNRDGKPDLAVANSGSDDISVLLGNGDGTFQAETAYGVGATPYSIAVGDFNRDGKPDLAVANYYSFSISVLLGNGDGTFGLPADIGTGYNPLFVTAADLNGDGLLDLAVANYWSSDVSILSGAGDGNFLEAVNFKVGANPDAIAVSDFSRDGKPDLAIACEGADKVYVASVKGDGTFLAPAGFATDQRPAALVAGDFDRDGKIDVATSNWGANSVSVLLNWKDAVTAPGTPAGINLNGLLKDKGVPGLSYGFSSGASSNSLGHQVEYQFDWKGDGTDLSSWGSSTKSNGWDRPGTYSVRARARCAAHPEVVSPWSSGVSIDIGGPALTDLLIEGGVAYTSKNTVGITYAVSPAATQIRTSTGAAWSAWMALPVVNHTVSLGTAAGQRPVYAQVMDADGRISAVAWDTITLDTKAPTGVVKINGGSTTVLSGGPVVTAVRLQLAMFDPTLGGGQVRVKTDSTFNGETDASAPWGPFAAGTTGQDVVLTGTGLKKVFVQFMDGVGLKSAVYSAGITVSGTGASWPGPSAVTVSNVQLNGGKPYATSGAVQLTYEVSQSTNIKVRYLTGTAWTAWETPTVSAGKVSKTITLSGAAGTRQVYLQLMEEAGSANPGAMTDPQFASVVLDTAAPKTFVQVNHGATSVGRFNTNPNSLILTILATDSESGPDKIALFQTGSLPSATTPPAEDSPDWFDFTPTVDSFGLNTGTLGSKAVFVWIKDRAGKISALKAAPFKLVP